FLMETHHKCLKIGNYWMRIPKYEHHSKCKHCQQTETIDHILFKCPQNHGKRLWAIAKVICDRRKITWPTNLNVSHVMAAPIARINTTIGQLKNGKTRLFRIVVLECAWQVWKARCCRVMNPNRPLTTLKEVTNTFQAGLNEKLQQDIMSTCCKRFSHKALPAKLVLHTWSGNLQEEERFPDSWLHSSRVLVGIPDRESHTHA
ncbi:uncharacterized protein EI90DRAFT_2923936, partial [Cantharellus anzutake]|uniref:uncharacterized protein n=1 Tax=Cantharellus anzutake TaxID=1750568 RepID=UPI001908D0D7